MKSELSEAARRLIETATAEELKPGLAHQARLLSAVRARAALPAAGLGHTAPIPPSAPPAVPPLTIWKLAGVAAAGAGVGLTALGVLTPLVAHSPPNRAEVPIARRQADFPATRALGEPPAAPAEALPVEPARRAPTAVDGASVSRAPGSQPKTPVPESWREPQVGAEPSAASSGAIALRAELLLLERMQGALRAGQASRALELVSQHEREFPQGQLRSERLATEVFAACQLGQLARARAATRHFLERDTASPLAQRVKAACGATSRD